MGNQKLIRKPNVGLFIPAGAFYKVGIPVEGFSNTKFTEIGLTDINGVDSLKVIPPPSSHLLKTNRKGYFQKLLNEEKELKEIFISYWSHRYSKQIEYYRTFSCYKRVLVDPLNIHFGIETDSNGRKFFVSEPLKYDASAASEIRSKYAIGILLQYFGQHQVLNVDLSNPLGQVESTVSVDLDVLPSGTYDALRKLSAIEREVSDSCIFKDSDQIIPLLDRHQYLARLGAVRENCAGNNKYVLYRYPGIPYIIAESVKFNQATYVFDESAYEMLTLDKQVVIGRDLAKLRIYHTDCWYGRIDALFNSVA